MRTLLERAMVLGPLAGILVAELYLSARTVASLNGPDPWYGTLLWNLFWALPAAMLGALLGSVDALLAVAVLLLLGPLRRWIPLVGLVGGLTAAAVPLWLTYRHDWLLSFGGYWLSGLAFVIGAALAWPVLTGRPWLPAGLVPSA